MNVERRKFDSSLSSRDVLFTIACIVFVLANLGAIGSTGRRRAKQAVCLSNLHKWGVMFHSYTQDHDGHFNPGWDVGEKTLWMNALRPYYAGCNQLCLCPEATREVKGPDDFNTRCANIAWWRFIDLPEGGEIRDSGSYSINSWTNYMTRDRGWQLERFFWKNVNAIRGKNDIPVFADATWHDAWPSDYDTPPRLPCYSSVGTADEMTHFCIDRHNGGINSLFMDWSARKIGLKQFWTLTWHREFNTAGSWTQAGGARPTDWPQWMKNFKDY